MASGQQSWPREPSRFRDATQSSSARKLGCFEQVIRKLVSKPNRLVRLKHAGLRPAAMPTYVVHARWLTHRAHAIIQTLRQLHERDQRALDLTAVLGAETEELRALDSWSLACVHSPVPTRWNSGMHLGTLSLALKHQMVYYDVVQRKLPSALVLEDDALLPQDLWELYAAICLPTDAGVFFLGSYAERRGRLSYYYLHGASRANPNGYRVAWNQSCSRAGSRYKRKAVFRRQPDRYPTILGTIAYIIFQQGAREVLGPVHAPADITLSLLSEVGKDCIIGGNNSTCPFRGPRNQYAPAVWLVGPNVTLKGATHEAGGLASQRGLRNRTRSTATA